LTNYSSPEVPELFVNGFASVINRLDEFIEIQDLQRGDYKVKMDGSPVGDLDLMIENFIGDQVQELLPGFQLIGEESPLPVDWNGNYLVVDPVDGTENYVSGIPIWGTGLALFVNNQLSASSVTFPEIGMGYASQIMKGLIRKELGKFRGPLSFSRVEAYSSNSSWGEVASDFPEEIRVFGCSLFNLILAATTSVTFKSSSKGVRLWDIAPAVLVALESGKNVKINGEDYFGEFLNPAHRFMVEIKH
jgi:myo-inositol-1(or 4)-monophosphatase